MILNVLTLSGIFLASIFGLSSVCRSLQKNDVESVNVVVFGIGMVMAFVKVVL